MYLLADQNFTFRAWKYDESSKQALLPPMSVYTLLYILLFPCGFQ